MAHQRRGRKVDYQWLNMGDLETSAVMPGAGVYGSIGLISGLMQTIFRIRGRVGVVLDTGGVGESAMILCGLTLVDNEAFAGGLAPEPFTTGAGGDDGNWIWQGTLYVNSGAEAAVVPDRLSDAIDIDTKAMRKWKPHQTLAFVHQAPTDLVVDQAGTYDLSWYAHVLIGA